MSEGRQLGSGFREKCCFLFDFASLFYFIYFLFCFVFVYVCHKLGLFRSLSRTQLFVNCSVFFIEIGTLNLGSSSS